MVISSSPALVASHRCARCSKMNVFPDGSIYKMVCSCGATLLKPTAQGIKYYHDAYTHEIKQMRELKGEYYCSCCDQQLKIFWSKLPENVNGTMVFYQMKETDSFSHVAAGSQHDEKANRLREELEELKTANYKLTQDLEGAKNVNQYYYKHLAEMQEQAKANRREIDSSVAEMRRMARLLNGKEQEIKDLHQMLDEQFDFNEERSHFEELYTKQKEVYNKLKKRYVRLEDDNFLLSLNSGEQKKTIKELESLLTEATVSSSQANFFLHHKQRELEKVQAECDQLRTLLAKKEQTNIREITAQLQKDLNKMGIRVRAEESDYDKEMEGLKRQLETTKKSLQEVGQVLLKKTVEEPGEVLEAAKGRMEELEVFRELTLYLKEKIERDEGMQQKKKKEKEAARDVEFGLD